MVLSGLSVGHTSRSTHLVVVSMGGSTGEGSGFDQDKRGSSEAVV